MRVLLRRPGGPTCGLSPSHRNSRFVRRPLTSHPRRAVTLPPGLFTGVVDFFQYFSFDPFVVLQLNCIFVADFYSKFFAAIMLPIMLILLVILLSCPAPPGASRRLQHFLK